MYLLVVSVSKRMYSCNAWQLIDPFEYWNNSSGSQLIICLGRNNVFNGINYDDS